MREEENKKITEDMGTPSYNLLTAYLQGVTVRIKGSLERKEVMILLDSGSLQSFIDIIVAEGLNNIIVQNKPITVVVANGQKVTSKEKYRGVQ